MGISIVAVSACQSDGPTSTGPTAVAESNRSETIERPEVTTSHGPVRGFVEDGVQVFKGIRYGADTSARRFQPPAPPEAWSEPIDALQFGASAPQPSRGGLGLFDSWITDPVPETSEDCLFLNVWTPRSDERERPVMVWLHGGGFTTGSGSANAYDGVRLANRGDVVVVTVNHRLNVFGYLYLDEFDEALAGSGNAGMMDLVAALEWVRDNIGAFGGNPGNVTIFGESGGGFKVSTLMAMPAARGLFHRAVIQSGPGLALMSKAEAAAGTAALLSELSLDREQFAQLRTLPAERIAAAAMAVAESGGPRIGARPVVDGVFTLRHPFTPDAPQESVDVPLLIGSTQAEMSLLSGAGRPELFDLTWTTLPQALATALDGIDVQAVIAGYRELHPELTAPALFFEATTDHGVFGRGSFTLADRKAAQAAAGGTGVYQYYLTWKTPVDDGKWGATHALDIGFVFDNVAKSVSMSGTGPRQQALADAMSEAWLAFARTGDPNHAGLPHWPAYDDELRQTMVFDDVPFVANDPRKRERAILDAARTVD